MSESPAKKARTEGSYYKTIDGVNYDKALLEAAEGFAKDGQISYVEAKQLWADAQDGQKVTDTEKLTLEYVMKTFKVSEKATNFLKVLLNEGAHKSYYKQIDGVKYDRELLEKAELLAADGQISFAEAKDLWEGAQDGKGLTETEERTLQHTLKNLKYTAKAADFMNEVLGNEKTDEKKEAKSYYKQIDGVKYDRGLLEKAEGFAKDGQVSFAEAKDLWEDAQDGKGVTETEKRTLEYTLSTLKYTEKAATFMKDCLGKGKTPSYYKQIDGEKYDRELLEKAEAATKTAGVVSVEEAKELWEAAQDGKGVTAIERKTLEYTMKEFKYTEPAAEFMRGKLGA
eukprot:TRINITY_DN72709_c0_g1_i1.p2 TRINITY_DN72709_c0_g1~~TRINITY_DN72709_c0_g1_i1.p2  ORF type:complete len:341 (+),score=120.20 TRINITY_DN72709_c0_g1_i1:60-1082(+)